MNFAEREQVREMNISQLKLNLHLILLADRADRSPNVTAVVERVQGTIIDAKVDSDTAVAREE